MSCAYTEYASKHEHFAVAESVMREVLPPGKYLQLPEGIEPTIFEGILACSLRFGDHDIDFVEKITKGTLHAFFTSLRRYFLGCSFVSFNDLTLYDFQLHSSGRQTSIDPKKDGLNSEDFGFEATVFVSIGIRNKRGDVFYFDFESADFLQAALLVTLKALLFFANSELAYKAAWTSINLSRYRGYITDKVLPVLAKNTDYSELVDKMRKGKVISSI